MPLPQEEKKYYTAEDYYNMPEDIRVELINGEIYYMATPLRIHQEILVELCTQINNYIKSKGGDCKLYVAPFSVQFKENEDTVVEPDISVICDKSKLNRRGCLGAPDWIIEIASPSNARHDYLTKLNLYNNAGVREYWIVDPQNAAILVYTFEPDQFNLRTCTFHDTIKAGIYDDLFIDFSEFDFSE